ncbi:unnamed protein product [Brassicogethes aeneus]|uniref:Uncharacterized protein n=1 Tax=Brassicogethes aeneus TaxID=1431903 RepID=A0A9P0APZ2_BRAAE|nr:unnamed protein product [Brassicogethes aeneus]
MDKFLIVCLISVVTASVTHPVEEKQIEHNVRAVRNSEDHTTSSPPKAYQQHVFNFQNAMQQDPKRNRYALQQQADLQNIQNLENVNTKRPSDRRSRSSNVPTKLITKNNDNDWVPIHPENMEASETQEAVLNNLELMKVNAPSNVNNKHEKRSNKKLKPMSYFQKEEGNSDKFERRQDEVDQIMSAAHPRYIYIQPNILKNNFGIDPKEAQKILKSAAILPTGEHNNYEVLSDLIGKNPNVQMEELRKLLDGPMANNIFTVDNKIMPIKPIIENQDEMPGTKVVDQNILKQLQDQLDMSSKEHTSNVLLQAQQQATAHVKAQHEAIAAAAERLNKEAYAKIAAQNKGSSQGLPQALALTAPVPQNLQIQLPQFTQQITKNQQIQLPQLPPQTFENHLRQLQPQIPKNFQTQLPPQMPKNHQIQFQQLPSRSPNNHQIQLQHQIPQNHQVRYNSPTPPTFIVSSTSPKPTQVIYIPSPQVKDVKAIYPSKLQQIHVKPTEMAYTIEHQPSAAPVTAKLVDAQTFNKEFQTHPLQTKAKFVAQHAHEIKAAQNYIIPVPNYKTIAIPSAKPNMDLYAPTHHHQITALLQAERVVAAQVKQQNQAILQAHAQKEAARQSALIHQKNEETKKKAHKEQQQLPTTYHEVILDEDSDNKINSRPYRQHDENQDVSSNIINAKMSDFTNHVIHKRDTDLKPVDYDYYTEHNKSYIDYDDGDYDSTTLINDSTFYPLDVASSNNRNISLYESLEQIKSLPLRRPYVNNPKRYTSLHDLTLKDKDSKTIIVINNLQYAAKYAFGYQIRDNKMGNDFGHEEKRDGKMAKGEYHVLLPDGRMQNVEYYADDSGYHAKVSYKNMAQH